MGTESFIGDVLRGHAEYQMKGSKNEVGSETIKKIINSLTVLSSSQQDLLHLPRKRPRDFEVIQNFEANAISAQAQHRRK